MVNTLYTVYLTPICLYALYPAPIGHMRNQCVSSSMVGYQIKDQHCNRLTDYNAMDLVGSLYIRAVGPLRIRPIVTADRNPMCNSLS